MNEQILMINMSLSDFKERLGSVLYESIAPFIATVEPASGGERAFSVKESSNTQLEDSIRQPKQTEEAKNDAKKRCEELLEQLKDYENMSLHQLRNVLDYKNMFLLRLSLKNTNDESISGLVQQLVDTIGFAVNRMIKLYVAGDYEHTPGMRLYLRTPIEKNEFEMLYPLNETSSDSVTLHCSIMENNPFIEKEKSSKKLPQDLDVDLNWITVRYLAGLGIVDNETNGIPDDFGKLSFELRIEE